VLWTIQKLAMLINSGANSTKDIADNYFVGQKQAYQALIPANTTQIIVENQRRKLAKSDDLLFFEIYQ
jgi:hypothetical protein